MKPPAFSPRPGGGFNPGMGQFNEHMDEQAMMQAMKQKTLAQQAATQTGPVPTLTSSAGSSNTVPFPNANQTEPSAVTDTSLFDAVVTRPLGDIAETFVEALGLEGVLGLIKGADTPEEKMKRQKMMQRYNQLTEEEQAVARAKYQERMKQEQIRKQEEEQRKQMEAQQKEQSVVMPSSPQKGPDAGGGSRKQKAVTKLQNDRKTLGGPQSAG